MAIFTSRRKKHFGKHYDPRLVRRHRACAISRIPDCADPNLPGILSDRVDSRVFEKSERSNFDRCPAD